MSTETKTETAGAGAEDLTQLYLAVGKIVARKYYCNFCAGRRDAALAKAKDGPKAFLLAAVNHTGMICSCAEWIIDTAQDALPTAPNSPPHGASF